MHLKDFSSETPVSIFFKLHVESSVKKGAVKLYKRSLSHYLVRRPPCQNMVKTIPKTFLQNQVSFGTESLYKAFRAQASTDDHRVTFEV